MQMTQKKDNLNALLPTTDSLGTVLIVEDNRELLLMTEEFFNLIGYHTLSAMNAPAAIEILKERPDVDLLFTDIIMPERISGLELAEIAKRMCPNIKVLLTSAHPIESLVTKDYSRELSFIMKPYNYMQLVEKVHSTRTLH
jgi:DNA-binding NtrC family response regulator